MKKMFKILGILTLITVMGFLNISCNDPADTDSSNTTDTDSSNTTFVAVTNITGVPAAGTVGTALTLTGTVNPTNATNKTIVWSVQNAGTTGAAITGSALNTTAIGTTVIRATITNGKAKSENYTQDFNITISVADPGNDVPAAPSVITINRTGSTASNFLYSVTAVTNATGYETRTTDGTEIGTWSSNNATVPAASVNATGFTELRAFAKNSAGTSTGHAKVPGLVKQPELDNYDDWFKFLHRTLSTLLGMEETLPTPINTLRNAINTEFGGGVNSGTLADAKTLHNTANDAMALIFANWPGIMTYLNNPPEYDVEFAVEALSIINSVMPRIWFNASELNITGTGRTGLDAEMLQRIKVSYPAVNSVN